MRAERMKKLPLAERLKYSGRSVAGNDEAMIFRSDSYGNKQMTFTSKKDQREKESERKAMEIHLERKAMRRSAGKITKTFKKPSGGFVNRKR